MLASNFLTADALQIKEEERTALITVLGMLERGELVHVLEDKDGDLKSTVTNGFNMQCPGLVTSCGTVACIGGWAAFINKWDARLYVGTSHAAEWSHSEALHELYYPSGDAEYANITPPQAAEALRNFLTYGKPCWDDVLEAV